MGLPQDLSSNSRVASFGPFVASSRTSCHRAETNSLIQLRMIERGERLRFADEALEAVRVG